MQTLHATIGTAHIVFALLLMTLGCQTMPGSLLPAMPRPLHKKTYVIANDRTLSTVSDSSQAVSECRVDPGGNGAQPTATIGDVEIQIDQDNLIVDQQVVAAIPPTASRIELRDVDGEVTVTADGTTLHRFPQDRDSANDDDTSTR